MRYRVAAWVHAVVLLWILGLVAGCSSEDSIQTTTTLATTTSSITTTAPTTTSSSTTTTTLPPTTTTTIPPTPEELRAAYLASLADDGWVRYTDPEIGWSISYPADWEVIDDTQDSLFVVVTPGGGALTVTVALDALPEDSGSSDYLDGSVEFAVGEGVLKPPAADDDWFWLDHDFDGTAGLLDIAGVEALLATDPYTGDPVPEDSVGPTWWYALFNPDARPAYAFLFETFGLDPVIFQFADAVVLSFEPPSS